MRLVRETAVVRDLDTAMGRALEGARYLDGRLGPGWDEAVDVERLDIGSALDCVLGQLTLQGYSCTPGVRQGIDGGFSCGLLPDLLAVFGYRSRDAARSYDLLTAAWKVVLAGRRVGPRGKSGSAVRGGARSGEQSAPPAVSRNEITAPGRHGA